MTSDVQLRLAAFHTVKSPLIADRTIQPTQVAGFNQLFDDANGTEGWLYGAGLDIDVTKTVDAGVEVFTRSFSEPISETALGGEDRIARGNRDEDFGRVYLYWTPHLEWAVSGELQYDRYKRQLRADASFPEEVTSLGLPLSISYFSSSGFLGDLSGTLVRQDVVYRTASRGDGNNTFFVVDATMGFRLPERRGLLSLQARNLFDARTKFQDDGYREFADIFSVSSQPPSVSYIPERSFLASVMLNF